MINKDGGKCDAAGLQNAGVKMANQVDCLDWVARGIDACAVRSTLFKAAL